MIPVIVLIISIYLVIGPIIDDPKVEYLYATLFILAGFFFYIPFVHYKYVMPGMGNWYVYSFDRFWIHNSPTAFYVRLDNNFSPAATRSSSFFNHWRLNKTLHVYYGAIHQLLGCVLHVHCRCYVYLPLVGWLPCNLLGCSFLPSALVSCRLRSSALDD